ncbi:MAG: hypothetical protein CFE23_08365 [Flavobacterium sp. BFFFF1]|nr:MAG: hypothetical protein CFE23_08365 [Flavobacterium sp. BFFFF1]
MVKVRAVRTCSASWCCPADPKLIQWCSGKLYDCGFILYDLGDGLFGTIQDVGIDTIKKFSFIKASSDTASFS